jgi:beta-glucosidase
VRGVSSRVHSLEFQLLRGAELAKMNLEITGDGQAADPEAMLTLLKQVKQEYNPTQLFVTNGAAFPESPQEGVIRDHRRTNYIYEHLLATTMAVEAGVPIKGYFVRSLLDGFEWEKGYSQRYGLIYADFESLTRTPKSSAYWFSNTIAEHTLISPGEGK